MRSDDDDTRVDVLSLEGFRTTLEGRLVEAESLRTSLVTQLDQISPLLGDLPDAFSVDPHYATLRDEHFDCVTALINALNATKDALATIIENYRTNEARLSAKATDIAATLGEIGGSNHGENAHAG
jgi:hypothetical protein